MNLRQKSEIDRSFDVGKRVVLVAVKASRERYQEMKVKVKVISGSQSGVVAAEARRIHTRWVVLDKQMKKEARLCMEQLECNIVQMKNSQPKVLRLNFIGSPNTETEASRTSQTSSKHLGEKSDDHWNEIRVPNATPASSPEHLSFTTTDAGTSPISSLDIGTSPLFSSEINWDIKKSFSHKCNLYGEPRFRSDPE
ncbi:hypothetical protein K7X08_011926 [Anisodus acutangulus]|uniref:Uncharacterized protein n=1 Tax=Anisodus acutangulus TaxID=402998 RepID=A0A9Q1L9E2_9SOLA|nr:hypothetical protein K7X08_011926 [Anisodus acutangulus]